MLPLKAPPMDCVCGVPRPGYVDTVEVGLLIALVNPAVFGWYVTQEGAIWGMNVHSFSWSSDHPNLVSFLVVQVSDCSVFCY